jgi:hypothetical protein
MATFANQTSNISALGSKFSQLLKVSRSTTKDEDRSALSASVEEEDGK